MSTIMTVPPYSGPNTTNGAAYIPGTTDFVRLNPPEPIKSPRGIRQSVLIADNPTFDIVRPESPQDILDRLEAEKLTPPSHELQKMARKSPPPQDWWDEDFEGL